ncbi:MAG: hypothetical protein AAF630_01265 [Cyanobacteria bacterium P01_C01_bin.38]
MSKTEFEVIPQIKRSCQTNTGKLFRYLKQHPSDMGIIEAVTLTLKIFWLPLSVKNSGDKEELRSISLWAIGHLENQINLIRRICLDEEPIQSFNTSAANNYSNSAIEVENSSDLISSSSLNKIAPKVEDDDDFDDYDDDITDFSTENPDI